VIWLKDNVGRRQKTDDGSQVLAPDGHHNMTDNWTPNRRAHQPRRKGDSGPTMQLINLLHDLVDCPECKLCAPLRQRAEHLLNEHYGHVRAKRGHAGDGL
jgi:hypothetical protein